MKRLFLTSLMIMALVCVFAISVFAEDIAFTKTESEEYGTIIQLNADPGLDNASQYVSTLNKISDTGTDKEALCILTNDTYFYVFPSSYIVAEKENGLFDITATPLATAIAEFNSAMGTSYYADYKIASSGAAKRIDALVRFEFPSDVKYAHQDVCCIRQYGKLVEIRINHPIDFSNAEKMFYMNAKLTTLIGFEKVSGFSKNMFAFCYVLQSVSLPTDTVKIANSMFFNTGSKASSPFTIPNLSECTQLTTIGVDAFRDSKKIDIVIPDSVTTIEARAFQSTNGSVTINQTSKLETIGDDAFYSCSALSTFYIPSTVTSIGSGAFNSCLYLQAIENFENCKITILKNNTFTNTSKLKSIIIPETVEVIENAFAGTKALTTVYIPKSVTIIADTFLDNGKDFPQPTNAVYIYTGTDASVLEACTRFENATLIPGKEYNPDNNYTGINLVIGYSHCIAYKNGEHPNSEITTIVSSYLDEIGIFTKCTDCYVAKVTDTIPALFEYKGISSPEDGSDGISLGFNANEQAIAKYETIAQKTLCYGVFAVSQGKLGENDIFDESGNKAPGAVIVDITNQKYSLFEIKIVGFTGAQKDMKFAMGTYVKVTAEGEETEYAFLQDKAPKEGEKYYFASFNEMLGIITD